ncbi:MAG: DUF4831 family protein [Bacteroidales bacterium]|nr:DUF4831 family protein [Bacteroidales bacterium]
MKKYTYPCLLGLILLIMQGSQALFAQFGIIPGRETREQDSEQGFAYNLPMHEMAFAIEVIRTTYHPGRYQLFSRELTGFEAGNSPETRYEIKTVSLSSVALPDPGHRYLLPRPTEARKGGEDVVLFGGNGLLQYYGRSAYAGRFASACQHGMPASSDWVVLKDAPRELPRELSREDQDTSWVGLSQDTLPQRSFARPRVRSVGEKDYARAAANRLMEIREARYRLLSGYQEVEYSREALVFMDEGLQGMEEEYLALFTGYVSQQRRTYRFTIIPDHDRDSSWVPLFRFSPTNGVNDVRDLEGDLVFLRWEGRNLPDEAADTTSNLPASAVNPGPKMWYRIPASTVFELRYGAEVIFRGKESVSQLGKLESIGVNRISVEYDPATGEPLKVIFDN